MKYEIDKKLLLEDIEGIEMPAELEPEFTPEELEARDATARKRFAIGAGLLGANAAGIAYALNKPKVDKAVGDYVGAKKDAAKQATSNAYNSAKTNTSEAAKDFGAGAKKGFEHPGRFQKNDRSQAEVMGHKMGQGTARFKKRVSKSVNDRLNAYRKKLKGML